MSSRPPAAASPELRLDERGSAIVWALFFVALVSGILVAHSLELTANRRTMDTRYRRIDLAKNIAESGLTEATAYLRRQSTQPVTAFAPQLAPEADPPRNETIEPAVGLVREFEVQGSLWARYEVRKDRAVDVSANYGEPAGTVWDLEARGYLYERVDATRRFDQQPNRMLSMQTVRSELRGLPVQLPASAAVVVVDPQQVSLLAGATVQAEGQPAISYRKGNALGLAKQAVHANEAEAEEHEHEDHGQSEEHADHGKSAAATAMAAQKLAALDSQLVGLPKSVAVEELSVAVQDVFQMRSEQVRNLSDVVLANPKQIQGKSAQDLAVFAPGDLVLGPTGSALRGRMLLFVDGDFTAQAGNGSDFSGVLYVAGNASIEGPFQFHGTLVVAGTLKVGGGADQVAITYDATAVGQLTSALGRYRLAKDVRPPAGEGAFAAPADLTDASTPPR